MTRQTNVVVVLLTIVFSVAATRRAVADDWATFRHDPARGGVTSKTLHAPLHPQWTYVPRYPPQPAWPEPGKEMHRMPFDYAHQVAVAGGTVYFGSSADSKIYALDAATGRERWSFFTDGPVRFAPAVSGQRVLVELGITPSFFVGHVYYWGDRHRDVFLGPDRAARISPLQSATRRGIRFTIHDDTPVTPVGPLRLVWTSVNRLTRSGKVLGPEQRITPLEALRAITIDAAWQNFEEDTKGSIEVGKLADFVVLSDNPLTIEPLEINQIRVLKTIVGDRMVFHRQAN